MLRCSFLNYQANLNLDGLAYSQSIFLVYPTGRLYQSVDRPFFWLIIYLILRDWVSGFKRVVLSLRYQLAIGFDQASVSTTKSQYSAPNLLFIVKLYRGSQTHLYRMLTNNMMTIVLIVINILSRNVQLLYHVKRQLSSPKCLCLAIRVSSADMKVVKNREYIRYSIRVIWGLGGILSLIVGSSAAQAIIRPDIVWSLPETSLGSAQKMTKLTKLRIHRGQKMMTIVLIGYLYILNSNLTNLQFCILPLCINPPSVLQVYSSNRLCDSCSQTLNCLMILFLQSLTVFDLIPEKLTLRLLSARPYDPLTLLSVYKIEHLVSVLLMSIQLNLIMDDLSFLNMVLLRKVRNNLKSIIQKGAIRTSDSTLKGNLPLCKYSIV